MDHREKVYCNHRQENRYILQRMKTCGTNYHQELHKCWGNVAPSVSALCSVFSHVLCVCQRPAGIKVISKIHRSKILKSSWLIQIQTTSKIKKRIKRKTKVTKIKVNWSSSLWKWSISWRTPCWTRRLWPRAALSCTVCAEFWRCLWVHSKRLQHAYWKRRNV